MIKKLLITSNKILKNLVMKLRFIMMTIKEKGLKKHIQVQKNQNQQKIRTMNQNMAKNKTTRKIKEILKIKEIT